ncbi:MAG: DUF4214 domain-containing protein, partial [Aquihabitans sp.]
MKVRMMVAAVATAWVVGFAPGTGSTAPAEPAADSLHAPASAHRVWYSDFGSGVDAMAVDPATGRAFVRVDATLGGGDLMVAGPGSYIEPDRLTGPFGYPVAADGSIFVYRDGKLRRINPGDHHETAAWTVPGLTADIALTSVDDDVVWVVRQSEPTSSEQLYRFDPDTGTTTTSGSTTLGYSGPLGGGTALVGYKPLPGQLISFTGAEPGSYVATDIDHIASIDVSDDGSLVTALDGPGQEAIEYAMPGFVPTGNVYDVDGNPRIVASTTAGVGAVAIVSARTGGSGYDLRVWARGNPTALVQVGLPPMGWDPQAGDLVFSGDGKKLFFLVRDKSGTNAIARLVVADLATQMIDVADPIVVGSKGGAVTAITATLGRGTTVTVDGTPVTTTVEVGTPQTLGETHDRISFAVPAMEPGTKLIWVTNALGHQTSGGPVTVMDLGPFVNAPWFVQKQMTDITGKKGTPAQVEADILQLLQDGKAGDYIARLETGRGQMTPRAALIRLYRAVFSRPPDTAGLRYWEKRMGEGTRLVQVAAIYAGSNEFKTKYG